MLENIITEYLDIQKDLLQNFSDSFSSENPLLDYKAGKIPKEGKVGKYNFEFHGMGVFLDFDGLEFDIEFGDKGATEVFDSWRLLSYIQNFDKYQKYCNEEEIQIHLNLLEKKSKIKKFPTISSSNLYQLL